MSKSHVKISRRPFRLGPLQRFKRTLVAACCAMAASTFAAKAEPLAPARPGSCLPASTTAMPTYVSAEQISGQRLTFRLCAPQAREVRLSSSDLEPWVPLETFEGRRAGVAMTRDPLGLWSITSPQPLKSHTYRYRFLVDGVEVADPIARTFSQRMVGTLSTVEVTGPDGAFQTWKADVPHGVVSTIEYWSSSLGEKRRAHVYTPPGYMTDARRYPVLYLVHGAGGSDDEWTSAGRAHLILDNLIAEGKARPMIVVMPFGHTRFRPAVMTLDNPDFGNDLTQDLIPLVDRSFRTIRRAEDRAMAGLSMGGSHTLRNGLPHPETFRWIGVFSMGLNVQAYPKRIENYAREHDAGLRAAARQMRLIYLAMGREDSLYPNVAPTRALFDRYGMKIIYNETDGGHTWANWRLYLLDFAPRLFH